MYISLRESDTYLLMYLFAFLLRFYVKQLSEDEMGGEEEEEEDGFFQVQFFHSFFPSFAVMKSNHIAPPYTHTRTDAEQIFPDGFSHSLTV